MDIEKERKKNHTLSPPLPLQNLLYHFALACYEHLLLRGRTGCAAKGCDCSEYKCCTIMELVGTVDPDVLQTDHSFLRAIDAGIYLFISLSLYLFISLSLCLFISLSLYLFISLSLYLFIYLYIT